MAEQETLIGAQGFNPLEHGLWGRFIAEGQINHAAWMRACADGSFVGTCRRCGSYLKPRYPDDLGGTRTDYEAYCVDEQRCGWTTNAPGGLVFRRSSRRHERPKT